MSMTEYRTAQYFSTFTSGDFLDLYLALRDGGDNHLTACETVRGERQMAQLVK